MNKPKPVRRNRRHQRAETVIPWNTIASAPAADVKRLAGEMMRAAGPRDAPPWIGDLSEIMTRPERPPMGTEDALRQIAATGSDDAKRLARAELRRRGKR